MLSDVSHLSPEAQELIRLHEAAGSAGGWSDDIKIEVSEILKEHPELMRGLDEYLRWRDEKMRQISETKTASPVGHEMTRMAATLRSKKGAKEK